MAKGKSAILLILDGFGYSETSQSNAIEKADNPVWNGLWENYPHALIKTSGMAVGLPDGQMGNSEVGHMNIGAGRTVYQSLTRVTKAIADGDFFENKALVNAVDSAVSKGKAVHILGLLSPGGVHSHDDHLHGMVDLAVKRGADKVYVHAFLDGRDTPPRSALATIEKLEEKLQKLGVGGIVSMVGRYYAMDRDNRWERVQIAYDLLTKGSADIVAATPMDALHAAYDQDKDDEFCPASSIRAENTSPVTIQDGDAVVFMNFRPDRARELTRALVQKDLESDLDRTVMPELSAFVSLTEYAADIPCDVAYPPEDLVNTIGEVVQNFGGKQLRIAETEKYAHVTFFMSGGREAEFEGETRILVPSPKVATYDMQPEMSAPEVTEKLVAAIQSEEFDLIICNYANCDMVGHTGDMEAAIKAVEAIDVALEKVTNAALETGADVLITADHGNAELMIDPETGGAVTSHTTFPVPLVYVSKNIEGVTLEEGALCDLAPTLLTIMGVDVPAEMTGKNLIK
ncbi:2,3-bisphosphoglycerate-independent phosphoglycerate mutase [Reinekea marinisedimentorum]|uniref:2,3-bisphosphoglycerate-independent phosphoglycerate mutase n=1 Tax=Reinekea marinisedimentorum TaxID=230495 RepID=A0A4R3IE17_9GAMM|nr:2,3-bisphosphoglycerate-independent phosphoglycerate mutase [Reinekea marinisedimentorum]TCS43021.1 2,3-bisphosphoglycerate-independent phosphoglycerate mutase [Reinekea marinisedimentorum]